MSHPLHCCGSDAERHAELLPQHWDTQIHCRHIPQHSRNQIPPTHVCVIVEEIILQLHFFFLLTKIHSHSDVHWKTETDWFWKENTFLFLQLKALVEAHQYTDIDKVLGCYIYLNYILHSCWKPLSFQHRRLGALQVCSSVFVKAACMANSWILYTCGNGTENTWIQR